MTSDHSRIVSRYAKTAYLAYDSDEAGIRAADKAMKLLNEVGVETKVIRITGAKDPDEYIKAYGSAAFSKLLSGSVGQVDYKLNNIISKYDMNNPDEKLVALRESCDMLSGLSSAIKRDIYIQRLAELTGVKQDSIRAQIEGSKRRNSRKSAEQFKAENQKKTMHFNDRVNTQAVTFPSAVEIEERILGIIMLYPEEFSKSDSVKSEDFVTDFSRSVFERLSQLYESDSTDISALNEFFDTEQMARIYDMIQRRRELTSNGLAVLNEQIKALKDEKLRIQSKNKKISTDDELSDVLEKLRRAKGVGN